MEAVLAISPLVLCFVIGIKMCVDRFKFRQARVERVLKLLENIEKNGQR
jgi:hypothetical protein